MLRSEVAASINSRASSGSRIEKFARQTDALPYWRRSRFPTEWNVPPQTAGVDRQQLLDAPQHLARRLVREGQEEDAGGVVPDSISRDTR